MSFDTDLLWDKRRIWRFMAASVQDWINGYITFEEHSDAMIHWRSEYDKL
jgi:hypothetical protein